VRKMNRALVERLLDCGAEIDVKNRWGLSPLEIAVSREIRGLAREKRLVGLLLERGADMGTVSNTSWAKLRAKDESCARSDGMSGMVLVAGKRCRTMASSEMRCKSGRVGEDDQEE
jgi:hypothetical protein